MTKCGLTAILFLAAGSVSGAGPSCGSATCPLNNHRYVAAGWMRFTFAQEYIDQDRIFTGTSRTVVGALPNTHDEVRTLNLRSILGAQYGISDAAAVGVELPFIHREHTHLEEGRAESFDISGFGDVTVGATYAILPPAEESGAYLGVQAGLKLPSGATGARSGGGERAETTIQPGTGSLDAIVGLNYRADLFRVPAPTGETGILPIVAGVTYQVNGRGTGGYRIGNTLLASLGTQYDLSSGVSLLVQANGMFRGYADVGSTGEFRGNTGGAWIFFSPGMSIRMGDAVSASGYFQIPLFIDVHGIQQASKFNLQFGLTADLDLFD